MSLSESLSRGFAFDRIPVAALLIELDGTIVAANPSAARMFDRPQTALVGAPVRTLSPGLGERWLQIVEDLFPPISLSGPATVNELPPTRRAARNADLDVGRRDIVEGIRVERSGGVVRELELVLALTEVGRPMLQVFAYDITRHKLAEDAARARGEAEEQQASKLRLESLGLVAGGIAHDFNNLLVGVLAEASAAREDRNIGEATLEALRRIETAARRMAQLTRQLLAYAGRGQVVTSQVIADELVLELRDQLERVAADALRREGRGRTISLDLAPTAGQSVIEADANLLRQVVQNLVANAADAGSRQVDVATRVISRDGAAWWQLEVSDDGSGIDPQTLIRIFEPFFSTKPGHHGLGLSAVHGIVRRLGGDVEVDSKPGFGARFRVQLPIVAGAPPPKRRASSDPALPVQRLVGLRVLVVDDEPSVRATVRRLLERRGATVVVAENGLEAEGRLRDERFGLVISDVSMPGLGGYEVLALARTLAPGIPVILMSGYTERARGEGNEEVPDAFLEKPFTAKVLDGAIDQVLRG